ncbi:MAG: hypothetical protein DGJ47_000701 [Rickettsiaceae bacterium]
MNNNKILYLACLMVITYLFANSVCITMLYTLSVEWSLSSSIVHKIIIFYTCGLGISQLIYGPLSDIYGRKLILLISSSIFLMASICTLFIQSIDLMLMARFLQGIGAGSYSVISKAILCDTRDKDDYIKANSIIMICAVLIEIFAPIIGGVILTYFSWRMNFIVICAVVVITSCCIIFLLPETNINRVAHDNKNILSTICYNYMVILKNHRFCCYVLLSSGTLSCITIYAISSSFILQEQMDLNEFECGISFFFTNITFLLGCVFINKFNKKWGSYLNIAFGLFFMVIGAFSMYFYSTMPDAINLIISMAIFNLGTGLVFPLTTSLAVLECSRLSGAGSAMIGSLQMFIVAIVCSLLSQLNINTQLNLSLIIFQITFILLILFSLNVFISKQFRK